VMKYPSLRGPLLPLENHLLKGDLGTLFVLVKEGIGSRERRGGK